MIMLLLSFGMGLAAQEQLDTTIYQVVEEMPRFPGCENLDTTLQVKMQCAQQSLLSFIYGNIVYPFEAREQGNEGTVVARFVVEKDGTVSNPAIMRDIGGGCGLEVLRVIGLMNQAGARWVPAKIKEQPVRAYFTLPVKFRLEEAPPYTLIGADTVYTTFDTPLSFKGGNEALLTFLNEKLDYPEVGNDSCSIGSIDVQIIVEPNGAVRVLDMVDYNNLGFDFWYAASTAATATIGKWEPAIYQGRKVPAAYDLTMNFAPSVARCQSTIEQYRKASELANEGAALINSGDDRDGGIAKISQALAMFPRDGAFLIMRGQAYLDGNQLTEACADLRLAREIAQVNWYDNILPLICR